MFPVLHAVHQISNPYQNLVYKRLAVFLLRFRLSLTNTKKIIGPFSLHIFTGSLYSEWTHTHTHTHFVSTTELYPWSLITFNICWILVSTKCAWNFFSGSILYELANFNFARALFHSLPTSAIESSNGGSTYWTSWKDSLSLSLKICAYWKRKGERLHFRI